MPKQCTITEYVDEEHGPADSEAHKELLGITNLEMDAAFHVAVRYGQLVTSQLYVILLMEADRSSTVLFTCLTNCANRSP